MIHHGIERHRGRYLGLVPDPRRSGGDARLILGDEPDFEGELWIEAIEFDESANETALARRLHVRQWLASAPHSAERRI
jgi:hypothetical protein